MMKNEIKKKKHTKQLIIKLNDKNNENFNKMLKQ